MERKIDFEEFMRLAMMASKEEGGGCGEEKSSKSTLEPTQKINCLYAQAISNSQDAAIVSLNKSFRSAVGKFCSKIVDLQEKLKTAEEELKAAKREINERTESSLRSNRLLEEMTKRLYAVQEELAEAQQEIDESKEKLAEFKKEIDWQTHVIKTALTKTTDLPKKLTSNDLRECIKNIHGILLESFQESCHQKK